MTDETKNKSVPDGKEDNKPVANSDEKEKTPLQKLKEENDNLEQELIRSQKIKSEMLLGGTVGGNVQVEPKDPDQELADKLLANDED